MGYNMNLLKNKFRRLKIEVHHNKNKTSHRDPVIHARDPTKPFTTLRTGEPRPRWDFEVEPTIREDDLSQSQFDGFSDISNNEGQQEGEVGEEYDLHERHQTLLESTIKSYLSSHRKHKSRPTSQAGSQLEHSCECTCHSNVQDSVKAPIYHNSSCLQSCDVADVKAIDVLPKITKSVSKINYIEPKPARRGFWIFKRKHPLSKIPDPSPEEDAEDDHDVDQNTLTSAVQRIEIIAQSTAGIESADNDQSTLKTVKSQNRGKESTSFKRHAKSKPSALNYSRPNSQVAGENNGSASPNSRYDRSNEPWRLIMNDISLHAALLSTGSKPKLSRSSINLGADFTSSKHDPTLRPITNNSYLSELISFGSVQRRDNENSNIAPKDDYYSYPIENYNENTIPKSLWNDNTNDQTIIPINKQDENINPETRPSTKKSKFSVVSEPLEHDYLKVAETSAVYGGVFQDYNYSDESVEEWKSHAASNQQLLQKNLSEPDLNDSNSEVLPLNISSRGIKRIF